MRRDINLLPAKKSGPKNTTGIVIAVVITLVYVIALGLGILIPKSELDSALDEDKRLENKIEELQPQVDEYEALKDQLSLLQDSMESTGSISFSKYDAADALEIIKNTCPTGVSLSSISNNENTLTVDCIASDNYQIAQFALELERTGDFQIVNIDGSEPADLIMDENEQSTAGNAVRSTLYMVYDLNVVDDSINPDDIGDSGNTTGREGEVE